MVPLLFPFTYISEPTLMAMAACFRPFAVYQPSDLEVPKPISDLARLGGLSIRTPVRVDPKRLAALLKEFRNWAHLHQGRGRVFAETFKGGAPFFEDTLPSRLRCDILQQAGGHAGVDSPDGLLEACLFLQISQELDRQNAEVQQDLERVSRKERDLFQGLWGPSDGDPPERFPGTPQPSPEDPGARMTGERLGAWTRLLLRDPEPAGLYITDSRAVFEWVLDAAPSVDRVLTVELAGTGHPTSGASPTVYEALQDGLQRAGAAKPPAECRVMVSGGQGSLSGSLQVHRVPGVRPMDFFLAAASTKRPGDPRIGADLQWPPDTLVGLIASHSR